MVFTEIRLRMILSGAYVQNLLKGTLMTKFKTALLAGVAVLGLASAAHAEVVDYRGFYLGGFGGLNLENGTEADRYDSTTSSTVDPAAEIEWDLGWAAGGELGWSHGNGLMTGLEYTYRTVDVDNIDVGGPTPSQGGDVQAHSIMANATYQLPVEFWGFIRPYAGLGAGVTFVQYNDINIDGDIVDDDDTVFSYQGFLGLSFNVAPRLALTTEYRYFGTDETSANTNGFASDKTDIRMGAHNFLAGLKYQFGEAVAQPAPPPPAMPAPAPIVQAPAPRPAPVVAPAPAVPQTYIVFFDFDKSNLTPEAQRVLERAAQDVRVGKGVRIQVIGHTDRAGTNRYNQRLSERRATVVKNELVRLNVPAGQISARGVGETEPRVPTADGVREAQNRRAEIIFQ